MEHLKFPSSFFCARSCDVKIALNSLCMPCSHPLHWFGFVWTKLIFSAHRVLWHAACDFFLKKTAWEQSFITWHGKCVVRNYGVIDFRWCTAIICQSRRFFFYLNFTFNISSTRISHSRGISALDSIDNKDQCRDIKKATWWKPFNGGKWWNWEKFTRWKW